MENEENEFYEKNEDNYMCKNCDFKCSYKSDWLRHIKTRKHFLSLARNKMEIFGNEKNEKNESATFTCKYCNNKYKTLSGLWKHNQKCNREKILGQTQNLITPELVMELLKDNKNMQQIIVEQNSTINNLIKNGINNNSNNIINTNSHNKTFNLQLFLNETCKDAMNITEFVDSIKLQLSDLESVGKLGYVNGISNIIVKNLKALDVEKRPVHCTDSKREILYVKDNNIWEKEDDKNKKIRKAIKKIATKNSMLLSEFKMKHPDCIRSTSAHSDQYNKLIIESMGGPGDNDFEKENKIIKNITKEVIIDKNKYGNM